MGLALDEPSDNDERFEEGPLTFIMEKHLAEHFPEVQIDYRDSWAGKGFTVKTGYSC